MQALTNKKINDLKPTDKPYKVYDTLGLFVGVSVVGSKVFRVETGKGKTRKTRTSGKWPFIGLEEARMEVIKLKRHMT